MQCFIGFGANRLDRRANLEKAAKALALTSQAKILRAAPIFETPALVPSAAPPSWRKPFLNSALEIEWSGSAVELLQRLKQIEAELGRVPAERWAPRIIDLDLLSFGDQTVATSELQIPHPESYQRQFVLAPLKQLAAGWRAPGQRQTVLQRTRELKAPLPLWMGIFNLTPDSFADGGELSTPDQIAARFASMDAENIQILDLGAESTRPGAKPLTGEDEWARLAPALELIVSCLRGRVFRPSISVDTYHPETAARALAAGADMVNDVSAAAAPAMLNVLKESKCQYVLMHSLSVPADRHKIMTTADPVAEIKRWATDKLEELSRAGIALDRIVFDPGIGFGKSTEQSWTILREIDRFLELPVRLMVGHSRKSFLHQGGTPADFEFETLGASLRLADKGVDILRVHAPERQSRALRVFREIP